MNNNQRNVLNVVSVLAASVIRMFSHAFGENSFRKGLKYYLTNK